MSQRKIIALRGGNGSGKTFVTKAVMRHYANQFQGEHKSPSGIKFQHFTTFGVVGTYDLLYGGADGIDYRDNPVIMTELVNMGLNVVTEGSMYGVIFQPVVDLMATLPDVRYIPVCLSTTYEGCIEQINQRRARVGTPPITRLTNIDTAYRKHISSARKLHAAGFNPLWVSSTDAIDIVIKELAC